MGGRSRKASVVVVAVFVAAAMVLSFGFAGVAIASEDDGDGGHGNECDGYDEDNPGNSSGINGSEGLETRQNNSHVHSECETGGDTTASPETYTLFVNVTNETGSPVESNVSVDGGDNVSVDGNTSVGQFENGTYDVTAWADGYDSNTTSVTIDGGNESVTIVLSNNGNGGGTTGPGGGTTGPGDGGGTGGGAPSAGGGGDGGVDDGPGTDDADDSGDGANDGAGDDDGDGAPGDGDDNDGSDSDGGEAAGDEETPEEAAALVPQVLLIFLLGLILAVGAAAIARRVFA